MVKKVPTFSRENINNSLLFDLLYNSSEIRVSEVICEKLFVVLFPKKTSIFSTIFSVRFMSHKCSELSQNYNVIYYYRCIKKLYIGKK